MSRLKVQGYENLVRDTRSNAIVNTNVTDYQIYMKRVKVREEQGDQIRNTVKEINNLKSELREIKDLLKKVVNNGD
jgi:flagellar hook-associated protein FlgK